MISVNGEKIQFKTFNDGSFRAKYNVNDYYSTSHILWLYDSELEALMLWYLVKHIHEHNPDGLIDLSVPYIPNGRLDRVAHENEIFTLKYFADMLNSLPLHHVMAFDAHSHVSEALINRLTIETPEVDLRMLGYMHPNCVYAFPDAGSEKRYAPMINGPVVFGVKHRDWDSQEITGLTMFGDTSLIKGQDIIVCDDIVSRGSTLYGCCKQLKEMGANNIYVWISHTEDTVLQPHIEGKSLLDYDLITKLYTTNSIYRGNHSKIEVIHEFK